MQTNVNKYSPYLHRALSGREQHIIQLLKSDPEKAIDPIFEHYGDALFGLIVRIIGNEHQAHDVMQDCLIKYWEKAHTYDPSKAKLFTWLYRIARNKSIDFLRVENKSWMSDIQTPPEHVSNKEVNQSDLIDLHDHLSNLELKYSEVIDTVVLKGFTHEEASERLGVPLGTLKSRLKIGIRELRKTYADLIALLIVLIQ